jgi:membrane fusion protein, multidrug efflux system
MKNWAVGAAFAAIFGMASSGCFAQMQAPAKPSAPASRPATLPADQELSKGSATRSDGEIPVLVRAGEDTTLSSQMAGKIQQVHYGLGDSVKAGAKLLEFDCSEQIALQKAAEAEYRGARETHLSRLRLQALGAAGELDVTLAAASAEKARGQLALRESLTAYCTVVAPFSGKIARMRVKVAESVPAGHPLIDIVNPASLRGQLFVPAAWVTWIKPNSPFEVRFPESSRTYRARVSKLNSRVEGVSQQLEIEARFEGSGAGLLPGMVGSAVFSSKPAQ